MYTRKTIVLILVAVIAGLGLVAAIVLISIGENIQYVNYLHYYFTSEFNQIHRLSNEASGEEIDFLCTLSTFL
jgi:cytochrome c-type biogenesis protein CcmE